MNELTPAGMIVTGYKVTDEKMCCRGFQFELGKWYEHDGDLSLCESGFHFCEYPSGPWTYYDSGRLFTCEAEFVLKSTDPGADQKHVARRIRLTKEITIVGNRNTGDSNTGGRNTGCGNATDDCSGHLCVKKQETIIFDNPVNDSSPIDWYLVRELGELLMSDNPLGDIDRFLSIPNATSKKITALHNEHIRRRKEARA